MYKIKIYSVGKTKEPWLQEALDLYEKRLKGTLTLEWLLYKTDIELEAALKKQGPFICLTPEAKQYTSAEFSSSFIRWITQSGSRLSFVIGGAEGLSKELKAQALSLLSLSKMTFTHQITRFILVEQLYRALEIEKGSSYHK
jgi:23S rRNA (pseudouridine1915-N3)-methyltransferase